MTNETIFKRIEPYSPAIIAVRITTLRFPIFYSLVGIALKFTDTLYLRIPRKARLFSNSDATAAPAATVPMSHRQAQYSVKSDFVDIVIARRPKADVAISYPSKDRGPPQRQNT